MIIIQEHFDNVPIEVNLSPTSVRVLLTIVLFVYLTLYTVIITHLLYFTNHVNKITYACNLC